MTRTLTLVACLFAAPLAAQTVNPCDTAPQTCPTVVSTTATAQTRIPNTAADITLGLTVSKPTLVEAQRALGLQSSSLLAYLRAQRAQRLITTNVSFSPDTKPQKNAQDKLVGYTGSTQVSFRTTPNLAPEILVGALTNGGNTIDSTTFTPTEQEIDDTRRDLAAQATKIAIAQVETIAKALSMQLVAVRDISVGTPDSVEPRVRFAAKSKMMSAAAPAPPIETASGDQQISMTVSIDAAVGK